MAKRKTKRAGKNSRSRKGGASRGSGKGGNKALIEGWWARMSDESKRRMLRFCLHIAFIGVLLGALVWGLGAMESYVHGLKQFDGPIELVLAPPPEWMTPENPVPTQLQDRAEKAVQQLANAEKGNLSRTWFDAKLAPNVAHALDRHPYVARVTRVEKRLVPVDGDSNHSKSKSQFKFKRQLVMSVEYRRPVAQVWWQSRLARNPGNWYLLDGKGYVLEQMEVSAPGVPQVRPSPSPRPELGAKLDVPAIQAGLNLVALLSTRPYFHEIKEVDVSNFGRLDPDAPELRLRIWSSVDRYTSIQEIAWGFRLHSPDRGELNDTETKLSLLRRMWRDYKTLNLTALGVVEGTIDIFSVRGKAVAPVVRGRRGAEAVSMTP